MIAETGNLASDLGNVKEGVVNNRLIPLGAFATLCEMSGSVVNGSRQGAKPQRKAFTSLYARRASVVNYFGVLTMETEALRSIYRQGPGSQLILPCRSSKQWRRAMLIKGTKLRGRVSNKCECPGSSNVPRLRSFPTRGVAE